MTEALKCPDCAAPLSLPDGDVAQINCPYCNTTVLLQRPASTPSWTNLPSDIGSPQLAEIVQRLRNRDRSGATKVYRLRFGGDLRSAEEAIARIAAHDLGDNAGERVAIATPTRVAARSPNSWKSIFWLIILGTFATSGGIILLLLLNAANPRKESSVERIFVNVPTPFANLIPPASAPAVPEFAHQIVQFGGHGIGAGQFKDARSVGIDGKGQIYVGEYSNGRVQVFNSSGTFLTAWSVDPDAALMNLTATRDGNVLTVVSGRIERREGMTGRMISSAPLKTDDAPEYFIDAFVALSGDVYALDVNSNIVVLDSNFKIRQIVDGHGKTGEDVHFEKLAVNGVGQIFVLERTKGIFVFGQDGKYLNRFGAPDQSTDDDLPMIHNADSLTWAHNLAVDGQGRLYVSDNGPAIHVFASNGRHLGSFGGRELAFGVAVDDQNQIFASFRNQDLIRGFKLAH